MSRGRFDATLYVPRTVAPQLEAFVSGETRFVESVRHACAMLAPIAGAWGTSAEVFRTRAQRPLLSANQGARRDAITWLKQRLRVEEAHQAKQQLLAAAEADAGPRELDAAILAVRHAISAAERAERAGRDRA